MMSRGWRRMLAGVAGLSVLAGLAILPSAEMTDAQFTDSEYAASTTFTAQSLVAPVITGCTVANNGLGIFQSVTLTWTALYPLASVRLTATSGTTTGTVASANITASGAVGGVYSYSATLNQALLTSLVSNLLGSTTTLTVISLIPSTSWVSLGATRKLTIALLGLNAACTV